MKILKQAMSFFLPGFSIMALALWILLLVYKNVLSGFFIYANIETEFIIFSRAFVFGLLISIFHLIKSHRFRTVLSALACATIFLWGTNAILWIYVARESGATWLSGELLKEYAAGEWYFYFIFFTACTIFIFVDKIIHRK